MRLVRAWFSSLFLYIGADTTGGGGGGADTVSGGSAGGNGGGNSTVAGGSGGDTISGGSGNDTAPGGGGGSGGNDTTPGGAGGQQKNWREDLAGGDPRKVERLSRYATPNAVADALMSVQERISKGELRSNVPFPDKGTDAEKTAWRAEQGIPPTADKYEITLAAGRKIDEASKPHVDAFVGKLHGVNASPAVVNAALNAYYDEVEATTNARLEKDNGDIQATRDSLISEMGLTEFKQNYNLVMGMFEGMPAKAKDLFMRGRLSDGTPILGNVEVFKGLTQWARDINPAAALVPGNSGTPDAIEGEIAKIEKMMRDDRAGYNKDPKIEKRYLQLIEARDKANPKK